MFKTKKDLITLMDLNLKYFEFDNVLKYGREMLTQYPEDHCYTIDMFESMIKHYIETGLYYDAYHVCICVLSDVSHGSYGFLKAVDILKELCKFFAECEDYNNIYECINIILKQYPNYEKNIQTLDDLHLSMWGDSIDYDFSKTLVFIDSIIDTNKGDYKND